jgi:acetyl esterase/lipase
MTTTVRIICFALLLSVFSFHAAAKDFANAKPQAQYVYKTVGERKLTLDIDYPPDWKPADKRPAVVFFSGGWASSTPDQFKPQAEYFAKRGLVCARADYHHSGKDRIQIDKHVEDAISAMRWVRSHAAGLGIDPNRIVAAGGSAGGHLAACTFFAEGINAPDGDNSVSPKPNAMVLFNPTLNLIALRSGGADNPLAGMDDVVLKRISPFFHVCKEAPPTLFIEGMEDPFIYEIREFVQKSKSLGAPVEVCFTEGEPHGFFNQPPWLGITTEEVDEFLCRIGYLGKEPKVLLPIKASIPDSAPTKSHVAIKLDTKLLDAIVGHYEFAPNAVWPPTGMKLTIWREEDQLVGQAWGENVLKGAFHIYPESETNFFLKVNGAQLTFIKNDKREVTAVIHHVEGIPDSVGKKLENK